MISAYTKIKIVFFYDKKDILDNSSKGRKDVFIKEQISENIFFYGLLFNSSYYYLQKITNSNA